MKTRIATLLLIAAAAGCAHGPYTPDGAVVGPEDSILIHSKDVNRVVDIGDVDVRQRADGRLEVSVPLANRTAKPVRLQVLTRFLDRTRRPTGDQTPFEHIALAPRATTVHRVVSSAPADEFEMELKRN